MDNIVPGIPVRVRKVPTFFRRTAENNTQRLVRAHKDGPSLGDVILNVDLRPAEVRATARKPVLSEDYLPGTWVERYHA